MAPQGDASAQDQAKAYLALAVETLSSVASKGESESARVSAAKVIIETAGGKPKVGQTAADQRQDEPDGWGDLLDRRPAGRAN